MRQIRLPAIDWSQVQGAALVVPVVVDWPELQLTDAQVLANAAALAEGEPDLYPDPSMFAVRVERPH